MVIDNLEGLATFCDPVYDFRTVRAKGTFISMSDEMWVRHTMPLFWCADSDCTPLFLCLATEMQP